MVHLLWTRDERARKTAGWTSTTYSFTNVCPAVLPLAHTPPPSAPPPSRDRSPKRLRISLPSHEVDHLATPSGRPNLGYHDSPSPGPSLAAIDYRAVPPPLLPPRYSESFEAEELLMFLGARKLRSSFRSSGIGERTSEGETSSNTLSTSSKSSLISQSRRASFPAVQSLEPDPTVT